MKEPYFLAIIGCGPRGLFALEQFFYKISLTSMGQLPKVVVFENQKVLGTGTAWHVDQPEGNWINIADRALAALPKRPAFIIQDTKFPEFVSYTDWLETVFNHTLSDTKDTFHPRKVMGAYLSQRANSLIQRLQSMGLVDVIHERVTQVTPNPTIYQLVTQHGTTVSSNNVLMTLGHLKTMTSEENKTFKQHAQDKKFYFSKDCYSAQALKYYQLFMQENRSDQHSDSHANSEIIPNNQLTMVIKGLGLSMIDILRMVIAHGDGRFLPKDGSMYLTYDFTHPKMKIIPYSLDGLPPVPKPIGKHIDDYFSLSSRQEEILLEKLSHALKQSETLTLDDILLPIAREIAKVFNALPQHEHQIIPDLEQLTQLVLDWLKDPSTAHELILNTQLEITAYIKSTCEMAYGNIPFSLDYVIGQTWRQLQPKLYQIYSHKTPADLLAALIKVDDQTKRYSYGPPVESLLQILALEEADILDLAYVKDPEINCVEDGFELNNSNEKITAQFLIDAIIASPNLAEITDPLMHSVIKNHLAEQSTTPLGIQVKNNAQHLVRGNHIKGLYSLGRNIKGVIYGVDAILECFNTDKTDPCIDSLVSQLDEK